MPKKKREAGGWGKIDGIKSFKNSASQRNNKSGFSVQGTPPTQDDITPQMPDPQSQPSPLLFRPVEPYTPNQAYNRNSQYARYQKAKDLWIGRIVEKQLDEYRKEKVFWFPSASANDFYWKVTRSQKDIYIRFLRSLISPGALEITLELGTDVETNADEDEDFFEWTQISGTRAAFALGNTATPTIILLAQATGTLPDATSKPVLIRATPIDSPENAATLIIYTVPISFFRKMALKAEGQDTNLDPVTTIQFPPRYSQKAWLWTGGSIPVRWLLPGIERDTPYITKTEWYASTGGEHLLDDTITTFDPPRFDLTAGVYYKAKTYWNYSNSTSGYEKISISNRFYIEPYSSTFGYLFGNDTYEIDISVQPNEQARTYHPPSVQRPEWTDAFRECALKSDGQTITIYLPSVGRNTYTDTIRKQRYTERIRRTVDGNTRVTRNGDVRVVRKPRIPFQSWGIIQKVDQAQTYSRVTLGTGVLG